MRQTLAAALCLVACSHPAAVVRSAPVVAASPPVVRDAPRVPAADPEPAAAEPDDPEFIASPQTCASVLQWSAARVRQQCAEREDIDTALPGWPQCVAASDGAWALVIGGCADDASRYDPAYRVLVAHLDARGHVAHATSPFATESGVYYHTRPIAIVDFNRDGRPEVVVSAHGIAPAGSAGGWACPTGGVFTLEDDRVVPYAPARDLVAEDVRDVDGDGHADLIVHAPYWPATETHPNCSAGLFGPEMAAHALPDGSFSVTDDAARAFDRAACGPRPRTAAQIAPTLVGIACARMWGHPEAAVRAEIARRIGRRLDEEARIVAPQYVSQVPPVAL